MEKKKIAEVIINLIALVGIIPAIVLLVSFLLPSDDLNINDIIQSEIASIVFVLLFIFAASLSIYLSNPYKLILVLPLLCLVVLPMFSNSKPVLLWTPIKEADGMKAFGKGYLEPMYGCLKNQKVIMSGVIKNVKGAGSLLATLKEDCRPQKRLIFPVSVYMRHFIGMVEVRPNGDVRLAHLYKSKENNTYKWDSNTEKSWVSLDGISFYIHHKEGGNK